MKRLTTFLLFSFILSLIGTKALAQDINENAETPIRFADSNVKDLCISNWDINKDGELSYAEASAVKDLKDVFKNKSSIKSFNELKSFTGLTSISDYAFYGCKELASVSIPDSVTNIGHYAFYDCQVLNSIIMPKSIRNIGVWAFYMHGWDNTQTSVYITDLKSWFNIVFAEIESNPIAYGGHLIVNGTELNELVIPDGVEYINKAAFYGYYGLHSLTIPSSVKSIGKYAFRYCANLTSITMSEGINTIGYCAFECCRGLTNLIIPNTVENISELAYLNCSGLTSVTIGNSVKSIGGNAFCGCSNLTSVTLTSDSPISIDSLTWAYSNQENATLYVPFGCKAAYEAADYWKEFKEIVEMEPIYPAIEDFAVILDGEKHTVHGRKVVHDGEEYIITDSDIYRVAGRRERLAGDVNGDGKITIADVTGLVNVILGKASAESATIYNVERVEGVTGVTGDSNFIGWGGVDEDGSLDPDVKMQRQ